MGRRKVLKDSDILELHAEGLTNVVIAEILGVAPSTISKQMREMGLERNQTLRRDAKTYSVYDQYSSQLLMEGTLRQFAEQQGIALSTAHSHLRNFRTGKKCRWKFCEVKE